MTQQEPNRTPEEDGWDPAGFRLPRSVFLTIYTWAHVIFFLALGLAGACTIGVVAWLLGDRHRRVAHACLHYAHVGLVRLHPTYTFEMTGQENLRGGPFVICPNHHSRSDIIYLFSLPTQAKWLLKKPLMYVPFYGWAALLAGYLFVERRDAKGAERLLRRAERYLQGGVSLLNFPEGTRSPQGRLGRFSHGASRMALESGVPLLPVGIVGTYNLLMPGDSRFPTKSHVSIHIGNPLHVTGLEPTARNARTMTRRLKPEVRKAKQEAQRRLLASRAGQTWAAGIASAEPQSFGAVSNLARIPEPRGSCRST